METKRKSINVFFNLALVAFLIFSMVLDYAFSPVTDARVPWDYIFEVSPILGWVSAILLIIILIGIGAYFIQQFWNRLLSDVFEIREILFQEALSIILILALLSLG